MNRYQFQIFLSGLILALGLIGLMIASISHASIWFYLAGMAVTVFGAVLLRRDLQQLNRRLLEVQKNVRHRR